MSCLTSNGGNGAMKRRQGARGRKRDELPLLGIAARRALSGSITSRQGRSVSTNGRRNVVNTVVNKYANRRTSFFKSVRPQKASTQKAGIKCHESLWDKDGRLFRKGDIISITDSKDGLEYFGQIRTLISNQLGERFAALIWLVPTDSARDSHQFDAKNFVHVLSDSGMYPLGICKFVQHSPLLPAYFLDWKPHSEVEKRLREELEERVRSANTLSTTLSSFDDRILPSNSS
ncbi:unnamed protein product [Thelazia callipaeda]|uniref:BAH domain-containing protein n=1 Tax=Thelazia callipaeda TaxID=103827 RepID=A0A0N5D3Z5_THECL|nr:unnamed protein product [Thelazia callipaeda]